MEKEYREIDILLRELRRWVDGPQGPSWEMVEDAERGMLIEKIEERGRGVERRKGDGMRG